MTTSREEHWNRIYAGKPPGELTWFQERPTTSLSLIRRTGLPPGAGVLDVGCGASNLTSFLLEEGHKDLSALDVSAVALEIAKTRLGPRAAEVEWLEADVLKLQPQRRWAIWHDRAVFHFLTGAEEREAYREALVRGLEPGGHLIIATFALDGPERCSGLEVVRYSPESLLEVLGRGFKMRESVGEAHRTPTGGTQQFLYSWFQRTEDP